MNRVCVAVSRISHAANYLKWTPHSFSICWHSVNNPFTLFNSVTVNFVPQCPSHDCIHLLVSTYMCSYMYAWIKKISGGDIALTGYPRRALFPNECSLSLISYNLPGNHIPGMTSRNYGWGFARNVRASGQLPFSSQWSCSNKQSFLTPRLVFPWSAQRITFSFCCGQLDALL